MENTKKKLSLKKKLRESLAKHNQRLTLTCGAQKETIARLKASNTEMHSIVKDNDNERCILSENLKISMQQSGDITTKINKKEYNTETRMTYYGMFANRTPATKATKLVQIVLQQLSGCARLPDLPSEKCVRNYYQEFGIISALQTAELIHANARSTIAWDATTIKGCHLNEVHFSIETPTGPIEYLLTIDRVAGGRALDYTSQILRALEVSATLYAKFTNDDAARVLHTIHSNIKTTMTDRCPTNGKVVKNLENTMDKSLLMLNCAVHPLDGMCHKVRLVLKKWDTNHGIKGHSKGTDCCVANLLIALSKMMHSGKGDPGGFYHYCKEKYKDNADIDYYSHMSTIFMRYVGNRLHVFFHLGAASYAYREDLSDWLMNVSTANDTIRQSPGSDLRNPSIVKQLRIVGLISKYITAPWMRLIYSNKNHMSHLDISKSLFPVCFENIDRAVADPNIMLSSDTNVFGEKYGSVDDVMNILKGTTQLCDVEQEIGKELLNGIRDVLMSQMKEYFPGGSLANPSETLLAETKSAPIHNIFAERTLGTADSAMRRAPNASVGYIDSYVRVIHNHTYEYLMEQTVEQRKQIINFAKQQRTIYTNRLKRDNAELDQELEIRIREKRMGRENKVRGSVDKIIDECIKGTVSVEELLCHESFESVKERAQHKIAGIKTLLDDHKSIIGQIFAHTWTEDTGEHVVWQAECYELKRGVVRPTYRVGYWLPGEDRSTAECWDVRLSSIINDYITEGIQSLI